MPWLPPELSPSWSVRNEALEVLGADADRVDYSEVRQLRTLAQPMDNHPGREAAPGAIVAVAARGRST
jgi:hypothetical protein